MVNFFVRIGANWKCDGLAWTTDPVNDTNVISDGKILVGEMNWSNVGTVVVRFYCVVFFYYFAAAGFILFTCVRQRFGKAICYTLKQANLPPTTTIRQ